MDAEAHFHIRWASGQQDWERHNSRADAEESAKQLARADEPYTIEECYQTGGMCSRAAAASQRQKVGLAGESAGLN